MPDTKSKQDQESQYDMETRDTYRSMVTVMFIGEDFATLSKRQQYWSLVFEYFTHE